VGGPLPLVKAGPASLVVGLTGGIGSGKSFVAEILHRLGATLVDTDEISRALTAEGGAAMEALREAFGQRFVTAQGALDRAAMRILVFEDPAARSRLEAILHPAIRTEADRQLAQAKGPYSLVAVPLLFETRGYLDRVDRVLVVDCPEPLQARRTAERSSLHHDEVRAIMAAQWPRWRRLQSADDVVWNGGPRAETEAQCEKLHRAYCERALASATIAANPRAGR
jgi:dephospho-CoA kinase